MSIISDRQSSLELNTYKNLFIIGCGGIGSWVSLFSALSGCFKSIHIWDPDKVEQTNLNRTPFTEFDVGHYKVDAIGRLIDQRRFSILKEERNYDIELTHTLYKCKFTSEEYQELVKKVDTDYRNLAIDCRDGIYDDIKLFTCKTYKINYDGLSITIDGDPKNRTIWGQRQGTYTVVPSFICPSVFAANFVINDACTNNSEEQLKDLITFDSKNILSIIKRGAT
jgi:hypothetical protein